MVVALANDLRKDFYPYYSEFLAVLIDLLNTKDAEQLEWTFTCLAYLFKFLWRPLTKDVNVVFNNLLPLLSNTKPDYINNFAAESFAFVVRKVKDRQNFLNLILKSVKNNEDVSTNKFFILCVVNNVIIFRVLKVVANYCSRLFMVLAGSSIVVQKLCYHFYWNR